MKCKFCDTERPDLPELKAHVRSNHHKDWDSFARALALFDQEHTTELSKACSICPHGRHYGKGH